MPQRALLRLIGWSGAIFLVGLGAVLFVTFRVDKRLRARRIRQRVTTTAAARNTEKSTTAWVVSVQRRSLP